MFPLHDTIPPRTFPWVNYGLIAVCALVFSIQILAGPQGNDLVERIVDNLRAYCQHEHIQLRDT